MDVRFWGVRGSYPCWGEGRNTIGGNTSCVSLELGSENPFMIFDMGSGIIDLGHYLMESTFRDIALVVSHFHFDHIMGLPFFKPLYDSRFRLTFYAAESQDHLTLEEVLRTKLLTQPLFPVGLDAARAALSFNTLNAADVIDLGTGTMLTGCPLNHPGHSTGYRVQRVDGPSFCYISDHEHGRDYTNNYVERDLVAFVKETDLMVFDTMYLPDDMAGHEGWGHSTWQGAVQVAQQAKVKRLALFHVNPEYTDVQLHMMEAAAQQEFAQTILAREGQHIQL